MVAAVLALIAPLAFSQDPRPATLIVTAVDAETAAPIHVTSAELYLDVWGGGESYKLKTHWNEVRIPLGAGSPCTLDKVWCDGLFTFHGRITLRAEGYDPISSDHFDWLKGGPDVTRIRFPGPSTRTIRPGVTQRVTLRFRRPMSRVLRIVEQNDRPVAGAAVQIRELLARTNHCGVPEGKQLAQVMTGPDAPVKLPFGQLEFSISVWKPHHAIVGTTAYYPNEIDGRFDAAVNTITLRRRIRRPLRLQFRNADGSPARVQVAGNPSICGCGFCGGPLGKTDAAGRFVKTDFYPEEFEAIYVEGANRSKRWEIDPRREQWSGTRIVTLK